MQINRSLKAALVLFLGNVSMAAAEELPLRKAGLWEMQTSQPGSQQMPPNKHCIDSGTDRIMRELAEATGGFICSKSETAKVGEQYITEAVCKQNGVSIISHKVTSGDFATTYKVEIALEMNPPMFGQSRSRIEVVGKYLGECQAGQKPGDMIIFNGRTTNISELKNFVSGIL